MAIQQRRDPLLVTSKGLDQAFVQCFPIPRKGGTMKIRIGLTAPMEILDTGRAVVRWPSILEKNFAW